MNYQHILIGIFTILCWHLGQSQILQIDHRQFAADSTEGWLGDVELDFLLHNRNSPKSGQGEFLYLGALANFSYFSKQHHFFLKNNLAYGDAGGFTIISQGYSHFRVDFDYQKSFSPELFAQIQFDFTRRLEFRAVSGAGFRYVFFRSENAELEYGLAGILEYEEWAPLPRSVEVDTIPTFSFVSKPPNVTRTLPKVATYLGFYRTFKRVDISVLQFYQVGYDDNDSGRWRNRFSGVFEVDDEIAKNLHLILRFNYDYDFDPIISDLKNFFFTVNNGIRYKF